jgi:hypothetical protein
MDSHEQLFSDSMMLDIKQQLQQAGKPNTNFEGYNKNTQYMQNIQSGIPRTVFINKFAQLSNEFSVAINSAEVVRNAFVAVICICIKYKNRKSLFEQVVGPDFYVDWDMCGSKIIKGGTEVNLLVSQ